jgi:hypothetical protein
MEDPAGFLMMNGPFIGRMTRSSLLKHSARLLGYSF